MITETLRKSEIRPLQFDRIARKLSDAGQLLVGKEEDAQAKANVADVIMDTMKALNYNMAPLVPLFYRSYNRGEALSFVKRPYAWDMYDMNFHGFDVMRTARQIAKSTIICTREDMRLTIWPGYKSMVITPYAAHIKTFADRFKEVADSNWFFQHRKKIKGQKLRLNLYQREYGNMSAIKMGFALTSNDAVRGNSSDSLTLDEVQNFDHSLLAAIDYVLDASPNPSRTFAGSSLSTDTLLEMKYQESSQGSFHILCRNCPTWLDMGNVDDCYSIIKPEGPTCPKCGHKLDVTHGEIVHKYKHLYDLGLRGYHVPKLIVPEQAYSVAKWNEIYRIFTSGDRVKFNQEALGMAVADGTREITVSDLKDMCVLNKTDVQRRAMNGHYAFVISGVDWGGSDYNPATRTKISFTAHVMLGRNLDGSWDIIHMQDYSGNDYETISDYIMDNHIKFKGKFIVTDRGGGDLYNNTIKLSGRIPFHSHWAVNYTGPNTAFIAKPPADSGYAYANLIMMNKMESITSLFRTIKQDKPGIRCYQYPLAERALSDFTNILRVPQDTDLGESKLKFIKHPSKSDDFVQAINIALHIGRVIFGEPVTDDSKTLLAIRQIAHASQSGRVGRQMSQTF